MTKQVTATGKNGDKDIIRLCGAWGSDTKSQARLNIAADRNAYKVGSAVVEVVNDRTVTDGFYLRTVRDGSVGNNLETLPNC